MKTIGRFLIGIVYFITIVLVAIGMHVYVAITASADYLKRCISLSDVITVFITVPIITTKLVIYDVIWFCTKRLWHWVLTGDVLKVEA